MHWYFNVSNFSIFLKSLILQTFVESAGVRGHRIGHYFTHVYALAALNLSIKNVLFNGYAILGKNTVNYVPTGSLSLQVWTFSDINKPLISFHR